MQKVSVEKHIVFYQDSDNGIDIARLQLINGAYYREREHQMAAIVAFIWRLYREILIVLLAFIKYNICGQV